MFSGLVPGAKVVKAFNHLPPPLLSGGPRVEGGRRVLFLAGDDGEAKKAVSDLIGRLGFMPIDLGNLEEAAHDAVPGRPVGDTEPGSLPLSWHRVRNAQGRLLAQAVRQVAEGIGRVALLRLRWATNSQCEIRQAFRASCEDLGAPRRSQPGPPTRP